MVQLFDLEVLGISQIVFLLYKEETATNPTMKTKPIRAAQPMVKRVGSVSYTHLTLPTICSV